MQGPAQGVRPAAEAAPRREEAEHSPASWIRSAAPREKCWAAVPGPPSVAVGEREGRQSPSRGRRSGLHLPERHRARMPGHLRRLGPRSVHQVVSRVRSSLGGFRGTTAGEGGPRDPRSWWGILLESPVTHWCTESLIRYASHGPAPAAAYSICPFF